MPIDATAGGASSNSFATVAEADDYFSLRLFSEAWETASEADKEKALVTATRSMIARIQEAWEVPSLPGDMTIRVVSDIGDDAETYIAWSGDRSTSEQSLPWPRTGIPGVASDIVPDQVKVMQFEISLLAFQGDRTAENAATAQGLSGLKAGPVELMWKDGAPNPRVIPASLFQFIPQSWWYAFRLEKQMFASFRVL